MTAKNEKKLRPGKKLEAQRPLDIPVTKLSDASSPK
jgi:hypothetical protein